LGREIGSACSTYEVEERCTKGFWWGNLGEGDLEDPDVDERIISRCVFNKWDGGHVLD